MTPRPVLICVGSCLARRYKMNTLQALALPRGVRIQFRYEEPLVAEGLHASLPENSLLGAAALLGYVDCNPDERKPGKSCFVVPYREAKVVYSCRRGLVYILLFEFGPLRQSRDLERFSA